MSNPSEYNAGKMFIGGLSINTSQENLRSHFEKYGDVIDCVLMVDRNTGRSRSFGFVTMKDAEVIEKILEDMPHVLDGKEVDCKKAVPKDNGPAVNDPTRALFDTNMYSRTKKIFVGGLPHNLTEEEFKSHFEKYGKIKDCVVMLDRITGKPRGFGFISFENEDDVDRVMQNYKDHTIGGKWVDCKRATPKQEKLLGLTSSSEIPSTSTQQTQPGQNYTTSPMLGGPFVMNNQMAPLQFTSPASAPTQFIYNNPNSQEFYINSYVSSNGTQPQQSPTFMQAPYNTWGAQAFYNSGTPTTAATSNYPFPMPNAPVTTRFSYSGNMPTGPQNQSSSLFYGPMGVGGQPKQKITNILDLIKEQQQRSYIGSSPENKHGLLESFNRLALDPVLAKSNSLDVKPRSFSMSYEAQGGLNNKMKEFTTKQRLSDADTFSQHMTYGAPPSNILPGGHAAPGFFPMKNTALFKGASLSPSVNILSQYSEPAVEESYNPHKVNYDRKSSGFSSRADRSYKPY